MYFRNNYLFFRFVIFLLLLNFKLFGDEIPAWVKDKNAIYPSSTYISVLGEGKSKKIAKEDAVSGISKYLKTEINISTKAETKDFSANGKTDYSKTLEEIVTLNSSIILSGIEYTSPYYLKKNKTWYCVAYISRDDAWTQYFPTLSNNLSIFNDFYNKSNAEEDSITKYKLYSHTQVYAENLINSLNYARLLKPENEMLYENDRIKAGSIPSLIEAEKRKFTIYIRVLNDYGSILSSAISEILSETDFLVISALLSKIN